MLNAEHPKHVAYRLSKAGADDDPAVPFTINDGLNQVYQSGKRKEDGEEISGTDVGTERPESIRIHQSCDCSISQRSFRNSALAAYRNRRPC